MAPRHNGAGAFYGWLETGPVERQHERCYGRDMGVMVTLPGSHRLLAVRVAWVLILLAAGGCARQKPAQVTPAQAASEGGNEARAVLSPVVGYFEPSWGDSSGADGKGGVRLLVNGDKRLPLVESSVDMPAPGDEPTTQRPDWLLFDGPDGQSVALDFEWVTTPADKFYGKAWAGGGLAFNPSWEAIDATGARALVLWAKSSTEGIELSIGLHSASKAKGKEATGQVQLSSHGTEGPLGTTWRRFVIPLTAFPEIEQVDLSGLQQVMFNLTGGYPENERVQVSIDNVYLTSSELVSAVSKLGYLVVRDGVLLAWDSSASSVRQYRIVVNGAPVLSVPAKARSAFLPNDSVPAGQVEIQLQPEGPASPPATLTLTRRTLRSQSARVTLKDPQHQISPYIFGANWSDVSKLTDMGASVRRWGGNRTTKYNWKQDVDSAGSDWYYLNDDGVPQGTPESDKRYYRFIAETLHAGVDVNFTIPISDWIAKANPGGTRLCSFPTRLFPDQESTDGQGCGNGIRANGEKIWGNDPRLSMVENSVALQREFVKSVVRHFGTASSGGVKFYSMDNEPGLWMHTHRDTMPKGVSAARLAELNLAYARAVKSNDPSAQVIGFSAWGVMELAGSNLDFTPPGPEGYKRESQHDGERYRERKQHGGDSQFVYLLKQFRNAEARSGQRLIDVIDIHWYPELYAKNSQGEQHRIVADVPFDAKFAKAQWEALREWYDPKFKLAPSFESWTHGENAKYLWDPHHPVIPALKAILARYYPGTKLAINEYDTGSRSHYHGALLRAAALGIFMQEDVYMASHWFEAEPNQFIYFAHKLYGNYDDRGSRVQGAFVPSQSTNPDLLTFAAKQGTKTWLVLINKNPAERIATSVSLDRAPGQFKTYTLAQSLGLRLLERRAKSQARSVELELEPYTAMLVVFG